MKKIYLLLTVLFCTTIANAQTSNAVVFSELGEKFTFYLNGEKQNEQPQTNVKLSGLTGEFYQARVDFEDASLADFANNNFQVQKGLEVTYIIKKNKKGEYVLRFNGQSEMTASTTPVTTESKPIDSEVRRISEVDKTDGSTGNVTINSSVTETNGGSTGDVQVVETTTTTTTKPVATKTNTTGEKVSMGVNVGGVNMGVNIDIQDSGIDTGIDVEENSSTTVTKTTTTKTTSSTTATKPKEEIVIVESKGGCSNAMSAANFTSAKSNIASKGFDDTKLSTAKTIVKANCMTSEQIKTICQEFGFDESRLTFAKYAYDYCTDKNNYFVVNEAFSFSSSTDELNEYIESK